MSSYKEHMHQLHAAQKLEHRSIEEMTPDRATRIMIMKLATKNHGRSYEFRDHVKIVFPKTWQASDFMMDLNDADPDERLDIEGKTENGYDVVYVR